MTATVASPVDVVIVGAGSVGAFLGARLAESGLPAPREIGSVNSERRNCRDPSSILSNASARSVSPEIDTLSRVSCIEVNQAGGATIFDKSLIAFMSSFKRRRKLSSACARLRVVAIWRSSATLLCALG